MLSVILNVAARNPLFKIWIPAFAGMTLLFSYSYPNFRFCLSFPNAFIGNPDVDFAYSPRTYLSKVQILNFAYHSQASLPGTDRAYNRVFNPNFSFTCHPQVSLSRAQASVPPVIPECLYRESRLCSLRVLRPTHSTAIRNILI